MNVETIPVKLQSGSTVRIHGQPFIADRMNENGWSFTSKDGKQQAEYSYLAMRSMLRKEQLTSDIAHRALSANVQEALILDWGSFTITEQIGACRKRPFVEAIDNLPIRQRDKRKYLEPLVQETNARIPDPFTELPSFRRVRDWYRRWVAAGRDIRALVDFHRSKGNRCPRLQEWETEEIAAAIAEVYDTELRGSEKATWRRARDRIMLRAQKEGLAISSSGAKEALGKNAVGRALARRDKYPLIANRFGRAIADRTIQNLGVGPQGDYPLAEVEVDHTQLDVVVVHDNGQTLLGRPWLTALIDRYSRLITGVSICFAPPSWVSVMEALQVAVLPKDEYIASVGGGFRFQWDCFGTPDCLFCDNGPEFRSSSMKATEAVFGMRIVDLQPGRPDLKGKIERWLRTINQGLVHTLPGTTFSNPRERLRYDSSGKAILTLADLKWLVTKWIIDIYNQTRHSTTGDIPAERWRRGMAGCGEKPPPPKELIAPLVGMATTRKLRREGVCYKKLRWNSNELQALRNRIGTNADVLIRIDPLDISRAYVFDEETKEWVHGDLIAEAKVERLTLSQYEHLRKKLDGEGFFDEERALKLAQAGQDIRDFVDGRARQAGVVPKRLARFVTEGRKPAEHVHQERWDPDESEKPLGEHDPDAERPKAPPPDPRGPWRETVLKATKTPFARQAMADAKLTADVSSAVIPKSAAESSRQASRGVYPGRRRKQ